jgi:hypothetical protein
MATDPNQRPDWPCVVIQIMPLAFIASSDEDPDVATLWKDVWSESSSSQSAAARLYMTDILALLLEGKPLTVPFPA